jgi:prophage maintenance system killer protein
VDGNKRTAFAAADIFLRMNGHRIVANTDVAPLAAAAGRYAGLEAWLRTHLE